MINRIKQWDFKNFKINDKSIINFSLFLSIFAIVLSIPSGTPCLSANECQVGSNATFTNDVNIKSGTNYNLTLGHNYAQSVIANFEEVGGNHTGSVILKDNSGDMNLNGGLVLGTSATSTNGTIRWNGSEVQVYNSGWSGVGGTPTDDIGQVTGDSGSFTASTQQDNINIIGGTGITTSVTGDTLTISSSGGGTAMEFFAYINASYTNTNNLYHFDTEYYDTSDCFTLSGTPNYTITYTCADTRVFTVFTRVEVQGNGNARTIIDVYVNSTFMGGTISQPRASTVDQASSVFTGAICLNQNDVLYFGGNTNNGTVYGSSTYPNYSNVQMIEKLVFGTSQSCTNGSIN